MRGLCTKQVCALTTITFLFLFQLGVSVSAQVHIESIDLMIITHEDFVSECERLSLWKNSTGMKSAVVTWQDLVASYPGADLPERIKRGIANWYSSRGVRYVLLMGDADMLPVRYISMDWHAHTPEPDKLDASDFVYSASDLYYADLFNSSEDFDDWDIDKNGMYGELWGAWKMTGLGPINYDRLDMVPDVAVGRVPASTLEEARNFVSKVISYETHATRESPWLRQALLVADGVHELGQYDLSNELEAKLVTFGYSIKELYDVDLSNIPRPFPDNPMCTKIVNALNTGKGYLNFAGHGNPFWAPSFGTTANDYSVWFGLSTGTEFNASQRAKISFCRNQFGKPAIGDFDDDGDSDIIFFQANGSVTYAFANTYDGYTYIVLSEYSKDLSPIFKPEPMYPRIGDFNGDGRSDLVQVNRTSGEIFVALGTIGGSVFGTPTLWGTSFSVGPHSWLVGDFTGDSMDDLIYRQGPAFYVAKSTGSGFEAKVEMLNAVLPESFMVPGDYDGDSIDDLALIDFTYGCVNFLESTGQVFIINSSLYYSGLCPMDIVYGAEIFSGDTQGDGTDDLIIFLKDSRIGAKRTDGTNEYWQRADVLVLPSDGDGWSSPEVWHDSFGTGDKFVDVGDFNDDNCTDIILFNRHEGSDPFDDLHNKDLYPIVFAASCSTAEYAIVPPWCDYLATTGLNMTGCDSNTIFPLTTFHGVTIRLAPTPEPLQPFDRGCMAERFLVQCEEKGAVAYIGGVEVLQGSVNELNKNFIYSYVSGENILGNMWNYALEKFITDNSIGRGEHTMYALDWGDVAMYQHPSKVSLFGDPSLRVFETPEPTTTTSTIPPIYIVFIGGGIIAGISVIVILRKIHTRPRL